MVRIISDTSTMYSSDEAKVNGFDVAPLSVTIGGESYRELNEIRADAFVKIINEGHMPKSSQPAIGDIMELYGKYPEEEIINISMADGLSGTYSNAVAAAKESDHSENISVLNTRTLCGPHRYLVEVAVKMAKAGMSRRSILNKMEELMASCKSFLMPADFDYLRRGGRLSPLVSYVGRTIRLAPVLTQSDDGKQLVMAGIKRSYKQAIHFVGKTLHKMGSGEGWRIYITHAEVQEKAEKAKELLKEVLPKAIFELYPLTPAFITQGGPGCVAVQVIKNH